MGVPWAIGMFVMEWSKHERMLARLIAALEGRTYEEVRDELLDGQIVEYEKRLRDANKALPQSDAIRQHLDEIVTRHVSLRRARHDIVHGFWSGLNEDQVFVLKRKVRKKAETMQPFAVDDLMRLWTELQSLAVPVMDTTRMVEGKEPIA